MCICIIYKVKRFICNEDKEFSFEKFLSKVKQSFIKQYCYGTIKNAFIYIFIKIFQKMKKLIIFFD